MRELLKGIFKELEEEMYLKKLKSNPNLKIDIWIE